MKRAKKILDMTEASDLYQRKDLESALKAGSLSSSQLAAAIRQGEGIQGKMDIKGFQLLGWNMNLNAVYSVTYDDGYEPGTAKVFVVEKNGKFSAQF